MKKYFETKDTKDSEAGEMVFLTPSMLVVWGYFVNFCQMKKLPCLITNISSKTRNSTVDIHRSGRAIDVRTWTWNAKSIAAAEKYMNEKVGALGAYSKGSGKRKVIHYEPTVKDESGKIIKGEHFHLQVAREHQNILPKLRGRQ